MAEKKEDKKILNIEVLSREQGLPIEESEKTFRKIVVIGAGTMGRGISQLVASKGLDVILIEKNKENAEKAIEGITKNIDKEIARWTMTTSEKKTILSRIATSWKLEDAAMGDIVIESIPENMELKKDLMTRLNGICGSETIFITNTSTLSITE